MPDLIYKEKVKLTIDLKTANIFSLFLMIPIALFYGLPYYWLWHSSSVFNDFKEFLTRLDSHFPGFIVMLVVLVIFGIIAHEIIHGITWAKYAEHGFKSIKFGVLWQMLTPYCHCKEPMMIKHYILGALMPTIILGILPAFVGVITGNLGLMIFAGLMTLAGSGDFMIVYTLRNENSNSWVQDHPSEAGCYVYRQK